MSDPNQEFQPPPAPATEPERKRPANLLWAGVALVVVGIIVLIGGIANFIPGGLRNRRGHLCPGRAVFRLELYLFAKRAGRTAAHVNRGHTGGNLL